MSPWWRALLTALTMAATLAAFAPAVAATPDDSPRRGPIFIAIEPESGKILALCEKSGTIARVDPRTGEIEAEARAGESPFAVARHPGEPRLYVSCRRGQEVVEVDGRTLEVLRRFPLRGDPTGVEVSADGRRLYTALHSLDEVAVLDIEKGVEIARLRAGNGPEFLKRSPADGCIYVTNLLTSPVPPGRPSRDEITVIDDATIRVAERIVLAGANVGRQIAFTDPGDWAIVAISRPKNLIPMTQVARGWVVTNGFALLAPGTGLPPFQLLVDLPNRAFADLHAVAITPDDRKIYISSAGADTVLAIDRRKLERVIDEVLAGAIPRYSDHLGLSRRHVTARIP
ncbi:MAG: hypothetical protein ACE5GW_14025, partial [Planctomycetota bacterium]